MSFLQRAVPLSSTGHTQRETNSLTHRTYLENFHDFFLSCGPLAALECYEARSFAHIEDDAYSVIDSGVSDTAFCGFLSQPIALIMGARKVRVLFFGLYGFSFLFLILRISALLIWFSQSFEAYYPP